MFPEEFDPWNLIAVPVVWVILGYLLVQEFISAHWKTKPPSELEL